MASKILIWVLAFLIATGGNLTWAYTLYVGTGAEAAFGNGTDCSVDGDCGFDNLDDLATELAADTPPNGSDILFNRSETFPLTANAKNFLINWNGVSAANQIILGAYGTGADPIIDGEMNYPGDSGGTTIESCKVGGDYTGSACTTNIVRAVGKQYIRIENITFQNLIGRGPSFSDGCTNIEIYNMKVLWTWGYAFRFSGSSSSGITVELSEFSYSAQNVWYGPSNLHKGGGVVFSAAASDIVFKNNYVHDAGGEGVDLISGVTDWDVYGNRCENNAHASIVVDQAGGGGSYAKIRHNTIIKNSEAGRGVKYGGITINAETETRDYTVGDVLAISNLIAGPGRNCFTIGSYNSRQPSYKNVRIMDNTCLGTQFAFRISSSYAGSDWTGSVISGNIFEITDQPFFSSEGNLNDAYANGLRYEGNFWSKKGGFTQSDLYANARHAKDKYGTNPTVTTATQVANMLNEELEIKDARLPDGSRAINSTIDNSSEEAERFAPTDTDPQTATKVTPVVLDFGAVDYSSTGTPDPEDNCNNFQDDDGDDLIDCADPDCYSEDYCEQPESTCDDDWDNDGDGLVDCFEGAEDPDCLCSAPDSRSVGLKIEGGWWRE